MPSKPSTNPSDPPRRDARRAALLRCGRALEVATLSWNVFAIVVLTLAAVRSRSVALVGFDLDSLIEIGASVVVLWDLADPGGRRQRPALRLVRAAFAALGVYLLGQSLVVLAVGHRPGESVLGIGWTAATAVVMFGLAAGKARVGRLLGNVVLIAESWVTVVDGLLAAAVLVALVLDSTLGWWWADPVAALVLCLYAAREVRHLTHELRSPVA